MATCFDAATDPNPQDWGRAYDQFLALTQAIYPSMGSAISYDDFGKLFPLFCFDLRKKENDMWDPQNTPRVAIHWQREQDATPYKLFVVLFYEREGSITAINGQTKFTVGRQ